MFARVADVASRPLLGRYWAATGPLLSRLWIGDGGVHGVRGGPDEDLDGGSDWVLGRRRDSRRLDPLMSLSRFDVNADVSRDPTELSAPLLIASRRPRGGQPETDSPPFFRQPWGAWPRPLGTSIPAPSAAGAAVVLSHHWGDLSVTQSTPQRPPRVRGGASLIPRSILGSGRRSPRPGIGCRRVLPPSSPAPVLGCFSPTTQRPIPTSTRIFTALLAGILSHLMRGHSHPQWDRRSCALVNCQ